MRLSALWFLWAVLFSLPASLSAQDAEPFQAGVLTIQVQQVDFTDFNAQGIDLGYAPLPDIAAEVGGGMMRMDGRWKTTALGTYGMIADEEDGSQRETRYEYVGFAFGTAFNLLKPDGLWFIGPDVTVMPRFEQIALSNTPPANGLAGATTAEFLRLTRVGIPIDVGLNAHRIFPYRNEPSKAFILGLRAGYRLDSEPVGWRIDQGMRVANAGIFTGGWYGQISFAFKS